ncbi:cache domain-containing protein [Treponema saccharophilum]|uniref:cache domain-containing protein n=1 Tax=Treponema saccharophilum TaxID=165 RepID=UPI0011471F0D|nr:cache domain-containing protein [Treponema saccharophilum]
MSRLTAGQKVAVSLLISSLLFAVFSVAAFARLFGFIEVRFYQPMITGDIERRLGRISEAQDRYIESLFKRFESFASDEAVRSYASQRPSDDFARGREAARAALMMDTRALKGIRIIDAAGINIHYSSFPSDLMSSSESEITYRKYSDLSSAPVSPEIPYQSIRASDAHSGRAGAVYKDGAGNRLVLSLPFYDSDGAYSGTIAFYCDPGDISRFLFEENLIDITGYAFLVTDGKGFGGYVFGMPNSGRASLESLIIEQWRADEKEPSGNLSVRFIVPELPVPNPYSAGKEPDVQVLFTKKGARDDVGFVSWMCDRNVMVFPETTRVLLLVLSGVTLFLLVSLLVNIRHDDMVVIRDRIKRFQLAFITESLSQKSELPANLAERRDEINEEIRRSLGSRGRRHKKEIDELLNRSWDDIFRLLGVGGGDSLDSAELKRVLSEIIGSASVRLPVPAPEARAVSPGQNAPSAKNDEPEVIEDGDIPEPIISGKPAKTEHAPAAENADEIEEIEEVPEAEDAEEIEEVDEVPEAEDAEEIEEVPEAGNAEEIEEIEEVPEAEDADEIEEIDEVPEAEDADEIEEIEEVPAEEIEEIEEVPEAENAEEIEGIEEVPEVEDADEIEEIEEAPEAEDAEKIEEIDEAPEAEDADEIEEIEEVPEVENADEIEEIEEVPEVEDADEIEEVEEVPAAENADEIEEIEEIVEVPESEDAEKSGGMSGMEDAAVEDFGVAGKSYNFNEDSVFNEELVFSSPENDSVIDDVGNEVAKKFSVQSPDYSMLDEDRSTSADEAAEVQGLEQEEEAKPFMLTHFRTGDSADSLEEL